MKRHTRKNKRRRGGMFNGLSTAASSAAAPFSLLFLQKAFQQKRRVPSIRNIYRRTRRLF